MTKHPNNRYERLLLNAKKKVQKEERSAKVWRKQKLIETQEQETEHELENYLSGDLGPDGTGPHNQSLARNTVAAPE